LLETREFNDYQHSRFLFSFEQFWLSAADEISSAMLPDRLLSVESIVGERLGVTGSYLRDDIRRHVSDYLSALAISSVEWMDGRGLAQSR
jgi:hypothetical protein